MAFRPCNSSSEKLGLVLLNQVAILGMNLSITMFTLITMMEMIMMMLVVMVFTQQGHVHGIKLVTIIS